MASLAQAPAAQTTVTFETASVKANTSGQRGMSNGTRGRTYTAVNMPLRPIIASAYELSGSQAYRLLGGPSWIGASTPPFGGDRFDITAALPEGANPRDEPAMLRALLKERFKLAVHTETRETPIYALVVARADRRLGPQLKPSIDCEGADRRPDMCGLQVSDKISGHGQRMSALARILPLFAGRYVVDQTGLTGGFDFELQAPEVAGGRGADGPGADAGGGFFTALQEQLGLKLMSTKGPLEFVVIDSIEHPSED